MIPCRLHIQIQMYFAAILARIPKIPLQWEIWIGWNVGLRLEIIQCGRIQLNHRRAQATLDAQEARLLDGCVDLKEKRRRKEDK